MSMRYLSLALLLAGCVQSLPVGAERPPNDVDLAIIDATAAAWRAAGQPWPSQCRDEREDRLVVVRAEQDVFRESGYCASRGPCCGSPEKQAACRCGWAQGGMGCAAGTMIRDPDVLAPFAALTHDWRIILFISAYESPETQARLIAHEAVHSYGECSGQGPDSGHRALGWWGRDGIEGAASR